jgi:hypothetical protein
MDDKELEFIAKRVEAATPAPWITGSIPWQVWYDGGHGKICRVESSAYDREFIAHARQDVPALLDEVANLKLQVEELQKIIREALPFMNSRHAWKPTAPCQDMIDAMEKALGDKRNDEGDQHGPGNLCPECVKVDPADPWPLPCPRHPEKRKHLKNACMGPGCPFCDNAEDGGVH